MGTVEIRPAPHVRGERTVEKIMLNVVWSLLPICAFYVFQYGVSALASITVVTGACLLTERCWSGPVRRPATSAIIRPPSPACCWR